MSLRGKAAIVGIGELPTQRQYAGRSAFSLCADAAKMAIGDAGLKKTDIDGLITSGEDWNPLELAEYLGLQPSYTEGTTLMGASGAHSIVLAAMAIEAGLANHILCAFGGGRDPSIGGTRRAKPEVSKKSEWENPFGPVVAANGGYALVKMRHMHEFGSTDAQFAKIAAGAFACVVTSAERAKSLPHPPAYVLGAGVNATHDLSWMTPNITTTPVTKSARKAFEISGYGPQEVQFAEFYD